MERNTNVAPFYDMGDRHGLVLPPMHGLIRLINCAVGHD